MGPWREQVSDDTRVMLDDLIKFNKKTKETKAKQESQIAITATVSIGYLIYLAFFIISQSEINPLVIAASFISIWHIVGILGISSLFSRQIYLKSKITSKEEHFEKLRHEVIDHLASPWFRIQHSSLRDEVSSEMEALGINVRYKNVS